MKPKSAASRRAASSFPACARIETALERLQRLYAAQNRTNDAILRIKDRDRLFREICAIAVNYGGFKIAAVWLIDPQTLMLRPVASSGEDNGYLAGIRSSVDPALAIGRGPVGTALREGRHAISDDIVADPMLRPWRKAAVRAGVQSFATFPLQVGGEAIGCLSLYAGEKNVFDDELVALLLRMAGNISFALERERAEGDLRRADERLRMLARARGVMAECNRVLVRVSEEPQLLREMCRIVVHAGGYPMAWIGLARHDRYRTIEPAASAGDSDRYLESIKISWADNEFGRGPSGVAVRTGTPQVVQDIRTNSLFGKWRDQALGHGYQAAATLPLICEGETLGVFGIFAAEPTAFDTGELELLDELAYDIAYGMYNLRVRQAQRRAEDAVKQSERRFRALIENSAESIALFAADGEILYVSPATTRMLGYQGAEFVGRHAFEFIHPDDKPTARAKLAEVMQRPRERVVIRARVLHRKGTWRVFEGAFTNLLEEPGVAAVVNNFRDVTEIQLAESALRDSEARYRALTELSSDWYWEQDAEFRFTRIEGRKQEDGSGPTGENHIGKRRWETGREIEGGWESHRALIESHKPFRDVVMRRTLPDGRSRYVSVSGEPKFDGEGRFTGYRGVGRDITTRRRTEQLRSVELAVSRSLAEAGDASVALKAIMRALCETERWDLGRYFRLDESAGVLRFQEFWGIPGAAIDQIVAGSRDLTYAPGVGFAGWVWQSGQPLWIADISKDARVDTRVVQTALVRAAGMRGAFVFPIVSEGKTLGVFAFNSREVREPDQQLLDAIRVIGSQIGQFLQRKQAEQVLRESEARFRSLTELSSDWYWEQDSEFRFTAVSGHSVAPPEEVLGKTRWELSGVVLSEAERERHRKTVEAHQPYRDFVIRQVDRDGKSRFVSVSGQPVFDERGGFLGYRGTGKDITEQTRRDEELRRFRTAMDVSADLVLLVDPVTMRYVDVNDAACRALGYTREELLAMGPCDIFSASREKLIQVYEQLIAGDLSETAVEGWYRCRDGRQLPVESFRRAVPSADGHVIVAVARDLTERKRAEQLRALEHAVNRFLAEADNVSDALKAVTRAVCESEGWECGRYFRADDDAGVLRFGEAWGVHSPTIERFIAESRDIVFSPGEGLAGRVWQSRQPLWIADTSRDPRIARAALARDNDIHGAFAIPVASNGKMTGVLAFSSREIRQPDERLLEAVRVIGSQIGQFLQRKEGEEKLRRFRVGMDATVDAIYLVDRASMRFIDVNATACRMLGLKREEVLALGPDGVLSTAREELERSYDAVIAAGKEAEPIEMVRKRKDGTQVVVELRRRAERSGDDWMIVTVVRDITARKRDEEELRRFRLAMDNSADMIVLIDRAAMRFVDVNETACKLLGYSREELLTMGPQDVLPMTREELERAYDALVANPSPETVTVHTGMKSHYRCKDGSLIPFESMRRVLRSGDTYIVVVVSRDIRERIASEEQLRNSERRFRALIENSSDAIIVVDAGGAVKYGSPASVRILGYGRGERDGRGVSELVDPADLAVWDQRLQESLNAPGAGIPFECRVRHKNGSLRTIDGVLNNRISDPAVGGIIVNYHDVTQHKQAEQKVRVQAEQQRLIAEFGRQALASFALDQVLAGAVDLVVRTLGTDFGEMLELDAGDPTSLRCRAGIGWPDSWKDRPVARIDPGSHVAYILSNREPLIIEDYGSETRFSPSPLLKYGVRSGIQVPIIGAKTVLGLLGVHTQQLHDFSADEVSFMETMANILAVAIERKHSEQQVAYLAQFDTLTGLPNRHLFHDRLAQGMALSKRNDWSMAVLFIDLDRFKLVNDTLGHSAGDKLLKEAATRLGQCIRGSDTVGRLGGDEFAAILLELGKPGDAGLVADKIANVLARPFGLDGKETYVTASIGITLYPSDGDSAETLIMNADTAMYRAKEQGRNNYQYFTREMNERSLHRVQMEAALRQALERDEFRLHYQPKTEIATGTICGFEALLRWEHPEKGLVLPSVFIPVLEDTGLIVPVGEWVLRTACAQLKAWQDAGLRAPAIAVNLSARQFQQQNLDATVRRILQETGVDSRLLELEITESLLMNDPEGAARTLRSLKGSGVTLAVDDFGTGYSSLGYLKRFPLDTLKIDRTFIRDISTNADDATLTLAIINLAHNLRLNVVAEGVETEAQLDFLALHACDQMQGFYFSRPVPADECARMLREDRRVERRGRDIRAGP
ncbi:MAG: PAS domain S-box protein [Burkholderiales bacterium]